jgi:TRAP-type C4-dicarboxylate transport system substrate-binding protein
MSEKVMVVTAVVFCFVVMVVFSASSALAQSQPIKMKYSLFWPAPHACTKTATEWAKEIEKRTNGRIRITMFPGATLTPADMCYDGVVKGISEIGSSVLSYTRGRFPLMAAIDLPLGFKSALQATTILNNINKNFKPKELDDVKVMYFMSHGPGVIHTKKPVYKLEDLKGMKLRSSGTVAKISAALGAVPVAMPQTETYDALSKGVVDGLMSPREVLQGWKFGEVVHNTTLDLGTAYGLDFFIVMNKQKWNSLPPDIQKIIEQINEEWIVRAGKAYDKQDEDALKFVEPMHHNFITLAPEEQARWTAAVSKVKDEYVESTKAKGLPGDQVLKFVIEELKKSQ